MIIRCPNCGSTYDISKQPQAAGRKVKCMRCSHVWKAEAIDPAAPAPVVPKAAEPAPPPPPAASEIAVTRAPAQAARMPEPQIAQSSLFGAEPAAAHAANGFNGNGSEGETNGYYAGDRYTPPQAPSLHAPPPRHSEFDADDPPPRRPAAARSADAGYFDDEPVTKRSPGPPRQPSRTPYREPPQDSYRDDAYGDYDRSGFEQDDFSPRRETRRDREHRGSSRGRRAAAIVGWVAYLAAVGALATYAYSGRDQVVAWLPGAAPYYAKLGLPVNRYGLEFRDVSASWSTTPSGRRALAISVGVENVTSQAVKVPSVVIAFKDANGDELFYHAEADALPKTLQSGKKAKFAATVPVPAEATRAIQVRFATGL